MALRIVTWLVSLGIHGAFALFMLMPAGGAALEQGAGDDIMVVEQGLILEGFAKLGEDVVTVEAVEAPPVQMAAAQPLPETVKPIEELPVEEIPEEIKPAEPQVVSSDAGPEQENVKEIDPEEMEEPDLEEIKEPEPKPEEIKELEPDEVEQPLPQQVATVPQESIAARLESAAEEKKGGDTTAHHAYLGKLRTHLERSKVNPRTNLVGTAMVRLVVNTSGELISRRIVKSSGSKILDDAAMASIERAAPFPPIPNELNRETFEVSVPFRFTVR
ncbi:MAG: TonB family protein [Methyloceanibacter sp.]|uniref:energy transducer TonB family protein n=1 Tax=Methyloceanibacter sp. TaxID=1965321 RepID=UPI003D6CEB7C